MFAGVRDEPNCILGVFELAPTQTKVVVSERDNLAILVRENSLERVYFVTRRVAFNRAANKAFVFVT